MSQESPTRIQRTHWLRAGIWALGFVALLWVLEATDYISGHQLDTLGIVPRTDAGLLGIVFAPVLHFGWAHLYGNTLPALILSFLVLASGVGRGIVATLIVWVVGGVGVWLMSPAGSITAGTSMLIFGWLTYLILRGMFSHRVGQIVIGVLIFLAYGSLLLGVLPGQPGVSWQGHLYGAIGGALAAWLLHDPSQKTAGKKKPTKKSA
ncbi:membrane associated rhomboid family serine protease [Nocardioides albertanoniae]|uniref:Membrane associated rhomboid family serine protease n=1 Tax=Nocardioides albertanoniae TaxID=1175486 RepID=A0A543A372_9ACTN|nr:rhomboid family intramembrane serine protease [Nocardioides albertanoniae]TQL67032.1 membrane associated rhomboid family serine protease [Nocardioides albertanoniae]